MRLPTRGLAAALLILALPVPAAGADSVIVRYRPGRSHARTDRNAGVVRTIGRVQGQRARVVSVHGSATAVAARLAASPDVLYAEPNVRLRALAGPDDPLLGSMPDLGLVHAPAGWAAAGLPSSSAKRTGVPVGIVDTGIDAGHEDLAGAVRACASAADGRVRAGSCADDEGHGSHVAGTIAATAGNHAGIAGLAYTSPLVVCKALGGPDGSGALADVANCIRWTRTHGARVISLSLGGPGSVTLRTAVRDAWKGGGTGGALVVAAAGNDGDSETEYPAGYPEAVSVAATDDRGAHAGFSDVNPDVEIAAPGVDVLSVRRGGGYVRESGTSMATPHVSAAAALLWDAHRRATPAAIRARLDASVCDLGASGRDPQFGFGLLDLAVAP